jgi:hypothetical protein
MFEGNLIASILITITVIAYGFIPILADFNQTHATNPLWTPHARFHVVWQVLSYTGIALLALWLIWAPGPLPVARLYFAAALSAAIYLSFFVTLGSMKLFGGKEYDTNGIQPWPLKIGATTLKFDANITVFSVVSVVLIAGVLMIRA